MVKCLICGMIINEKNYNLNKEGLMEENNNDADILYCPFCGVDTRYISKDEKKSLLGDFNIDDITLKVLDHAMKLETFNGDFYKKASELAKDVELKKRFIALSNIEYMHARVHKSLGGFSKLPILKEVSYERLNSDELLQEEAEKREEHAIKYYKKFYDQVCSDDIREIFDALLKVETEHIVILKK